MISQLIRQLGVDIATVLHPDPALLFATILFSRVPIDAEVAELFKVIGLNLRVALLPLARKPLFETAA